METPATLDLTFEALSNPARRDLVRRLAAGPQSAGALAEPYAISRPAISRHLRVLREAGLVSVEKDGREWMYHLDPVALDDARAWLENVRQVWRLALRSLKDFVENGEA